MRDLNDCVSRASDSPQQLRSPEPVRLAPGQQYGQPINSLEVGSFRLCERTYPPGYITPVHSHERALFCFVVNGSYSEIYGNLTRSCGPATLLFHPAEEVHAEHFHETGGRSFVVELETSWLHSLRDHSRVVAAPGAFWGGTTALLGRRLYKEFRETDDVSPLIIEGLLLELLGETARRVSSDVPNLRQVPRWLKQARELLRTRFVERLTLSCIAAEVGVHPMHLAQTFNQTFGCTVGEYIRRRRIEYACQQLATSNTPLATIALAAGFCDQSHFTRVFKRHTGVAPSEYRAAISSST
jgi:AraC family transcriptional regulator